MDAVILFSSTFQELYIQSSCWKENTFYCSKPTTKVSLKETSVSSRQGQQKRKYKILIISSFSSYLWQLAHTYTVAFCAILRHLQKEADMKLIVVNCLKMEMP